MIHLFGYTILLLQNNEYDVYYKKKRIFHIHKYMHLIEHFMYSSK